MRTRHLLQLVLLSALWGASFLFIRIASPALGPHVAAALRIGLATLTLVAIMRATREPWPWRHILVLQATQILDKKRFYRL